VHRVNPEILEILGKIQPDVPIKPQGKGFRALFSKMRDRLQRRDKEGEAIRRETHPERKCIKRTGIASRHQSRALSVAPTS